MAESNIKGVFGLGDIRKRQLRSLVPERTRETYREYGYFGGQFPLGSLVDRIDYSNDTATASVRGPLSATTYRQGASGNTSYGYHVSGRSGTLGSGITRIDYSNDSSLSSARSNVIGVRWDFGATGNSNFGWFGGGALTFSANPISTVERLNYSNDLTNPSIRGSLSNSPATFGMSGVGNSNFGWFISLFSISRINYSNDLVTSSVRSGSAIVTQILTAATGNSNFGYSCSGNLGTATQRINYSNDLATPLIRGSLSNVKESATGNSNFGYFGYGSTIDRIDYSNDLATASIRGPLSSNRQINSRYRATSSSSFGGAPNSSFASNFTFPTVPNAGYFGGGTDGTNSLATIDKVDYANDTTTASVRSALSSAKRGTAATGNSNFGYFGGGYISGPTLYSTVDRLEYSSDTQNTVVRGPLSVARAILAATGNSNFGYFGGGYIPGTPGSSSTVDRIDYTTDTSAASPRGLLILDRYGPGATGNQNFGYFAGGISPAASSNNAKSEIQRINYSTDLMTALNRSTLTGSRYVIAATGNSNFGYFGGGLFPSATSFSNIQRLDYSNDTQTSINRGNLSTARGRVSATGSSSFGFFGSGLISGPSGNISTTDRINYSNDTAIASIRGPLSTAKSFVAATSPLAYGGAPIYSTNTLPQVLQKQITFDDSNTLSSNLPFKRALGSFGYFGGVPTSRINFSNDSSTASVRGSLSQSRIFLAATGNNNFGYYGGGLVPSLVSTVDRIDYSNDLSTANVRGPLTLALYQNAATGNSNFGYFGGGSNFPVISRIDRIDYSNDSATALVRGPLSFARASLAATGNSNFGYFFGGGVTNIDRINYSSDTSIALKRGTLNLIKNNAGTTGNLNFGYVGGGIPPIPAGTLSTVERIDYSNDTSNALIRSPLSSARRYLGATGNSNFGYFGGGQPGPTTAIDRLDYSNDTIASRGAFSIASGTAATTNARTS